MIYDCKFMIYFLAARARLLFEGFILAATTLEAGVLVEFHERKTHRVNDGRDKTQCEIERVAEH